MKISGLLSSVSLILVITACATLGMPPDPLKNCEQLRVAIDDVKGDIEDSIPYSALPNPDSSVEDHLEHIATAAFFILTLPVKEVLLSEVEDVKELTARYKKLMGYSYKKECGFELLEVQSLINSFRKLKSTGP